MGINVSEPRSRRAILAGLLGGIGAAAAHAVGRVPGVQAANGDPLIAGSTANEATQTTALVGSVPTGTALEVINPITEESAGIGTYIEGDYALFSWGVIGATAAGPSGGVGCQGSATDEPIIPSPPSGAGVVGQSDAGAGVVGFAGTVTPSPTPYTGVYGRSDAGGAAARGIAGFSDAGIGLLGQTNTGTGLRAYSGPSPTSIALRVTGRAVFDRSGRLTIAAGSSSVTARIPLRPESMVLAVLQTNRPGVYVQAAVPNPGAGSFTIYLNKAVTASTVVAWQVLS